MMKIVKLFLQLLILVIMVSCGDSNGQSNEQNTPNVQSSVESGVPYGGYTFSDGIKHAEKMNKPVVLYFYTSWCPYCTKMDRNVFSDESVINKMKSDFVYIRINTEQSGKDMKFKNHNLTPREFAYMMGVSAYPTVVFLDKQLNPVTKVPGLVNKNVFSHLLSYIRDECYQKQVNFQSYMAGSSPCN